MKKGISLAAAISEVKDGMSVMIGGFLGTGTPEAFIDELVAQGPKGLTVIGNDTSFPDRGIGKLIVNKQVAKAIVSHIGTNPETGRQMNAGEIEVVLVPQGTLAEQIRAGGAGLGAVVTPTGVGTIVEEGKQKITIDGREYLIELPIKADVALLQAEWADESGNLIFDKSARNFNPLMAFAAETVIVLAKNIVPVGQLNPDHVMTPGVLVKYIVKGD